MSLHVCNKNITTSYVHAIYGYVTGHEKSGLICTQNILLTYICYFIAIVYLLYCILSYVRSYNNSVSFSRASNDHCISGENFLLNITSRVKLLNFKLLKYGQNLLWIKPVFSGPVTCII